MSRPRHARSVAYRWRAGIAALTLYTVVSGCGPSSEKAARKAAEAAALLEAGNPGAARVAARAAVAERDDVADYWRLLGRAELQSDNLGGGYEAYRRAIELDAANPESLQILSEIALRAGRTRDAVTAADQLLALQPNLTRPRLVKGMAALIQGDENAASRIADEVLAISPNDEVGRVLKARVLGRRGDFAAGAAVLEAPGTERSEIVLTTLAEIWRNAGEGRKLEAALRDLEAKSPNNSRTFDLASVQYKLGERAAARKTIVRRLSTRPSDAELYQWAFEFITETDAGFFDDGAATLGDTPNPAVRLLAARVLLFAGKADQADRVLAPLIGAGTPSDVWSLYATALDAQGKSGAPAIIDRILAVDQTNGYALLLRARLAMRSGDTTRALNDVQHVLREDPDNLDARMALIDIYARRGDGVRVRQLYEELLQLFPASTVALSAYAKALMGAKDRARAISIARAFVFVNPEVTRGWQILAELCNNDPCRRDATAGLSKAARNFTPPDKADVNRAGILGRL